MRAVLVSQSQYFSRIFNGNFSEANEQSATMEELDGILSTRSFEVLLLWLYTGKIKCGTQEPGSKAATLIEFARLADMYGIIQVEARIAKQLRKIINQEIAYKGSVDKESEDGSPTDNEDDPDANTHCFTAEDIRSVVNLPMGHRVRSLVAAASVAGFLLKKDYRFAKVAQEVPVFAADLLAQVHATIGGVQYDSTWMAYVTDPVTKRLLYLTKW